MISRALGNAKPYQSAYKCAASTRFVMHLGTIHSARASAAGEHGTTILRCCSILLCSNSPILSIDNFCERQHLLHLRMSHHHLVTV